MYTTSVIKEENQNIGLLGLKNLTPEVCYLEALYFLPAYQRKGIGTKGMNLIVDWTIRENVRAQLRVVVKRTLRKYGNAPDKQEKAMQNMLEQAEVLSEMWAEVS